MTGHAKFCAIAVCWLLACSQDVGTGRRCKAADGACTPSAHAGTGAAATPVTGTGGGGIGGGGGSTAVASHDDALSVHVEDIHKMAIEFVTLTCAGDCAEIEAVAVGGNAPYAFAWEDETASATRRVCLDASTQLVVDVTDTAIDADEFHYAGQTARAVVTAEVLGCTDAGIPNTGDAGTPVCQELVWGDRATCSEATMDASLVAAPGLRAGQDYALRVDSTALFPGGWDLEIWGSVDGCAATERLATAQHTVGESQALCLHPTQDFDSLIWRATNATVGSLSLSVSSCDRCTP